jgi:branched-chain amino acid transport system ATP-binding protein
MITVHEVTKRFGGSVALRSVSTVFPSGSAIAIAGPNGAGKTTLIDVMTGFVVVDQGSIKIGERRINGLSPHLVARLGVARTFQDVKIVRVRTCLDNVRLAHRNQPGESLLRLVSRTGVRSAEAVITARSHDLLARVGLSTLANRYADELSFGQQKLLSIACCLATAAPVMIFDEPFAGLAPPMREVVGAVLTELKSLGSVVIFVEHDMEAVRLYADRLIVMARGEIVADGPPDLMLSSMSSRRALLG